MPRGVKINPIKGLNLDCQYRGTPRFRGIENTLCTSVARDVKICLMEFYLLFLRDFAAFYFYPNLCQGFSWDRGNSYHRESRESRVKVEE